MAVIPAIINTLMLRRLQCSVQRLSSFNAFRSSAVRAIVAPPGAPPQLVELCEKPTSESFFAHNRWLLEQASGLSNRELSSLLLAIKKAEMEKFVMDPELGSIIAYEFLERVRSSRLVQMNLLIGALNLSQVFMKAEVEFTDIVNAATQYSFVPSRINKLSLKDLARVLKAYGHFDDPQRLQQTEFLTASGEELIAMVEKQLSKINLKNTSVLDIRMLLTSLLKFDRSSEKFIREMEQKVFSQLEKLNNLSLISLSFGYNRRVRTDHDYVITQLFRPYYSELQRRGLALRPDELSEVLNGLWYGLCSSGCYLDAQLIDTLAARLADDNWLQGYTDFYVRAGVLLANFTSDPHTDLCATIATKFAKEHKSPDDFSTTELACGLAKANVFVPQFWDWMQVNTETLRSSTKHQVYFYSLLLHLANKQPALHQRLSQAVQTLLPTLEETWTVHSIKKIRYPTSAHEATEKLLKVKKVSFFKNHLDAFRIDFVVPDKKVAINVCELRNYEIPTMRLNGRTQATHEILQRRGWRVLAVPDRSLTGAGVTQELDSLLSPLLS